MNYKKRYINFLRDFISLKKPLRVVFDCSSGATAFLIKEVMHDPKLKAFYLNDKVDGRFPNHSPNPLGRGALSQLQKEVLRRHADLGVAFDADGDRAFFVDSRSRIVPAYIMMRFLCLDQKSPHIADVFLYPSLVYSGLGERGLFESRVGTYFMKEKMMKLNASFGAEFSGHYYFKDFFGSDSGIFTAIRVLNILSKLPYSFSDYWDLLGKEFYYDYFNIRAKDPGFLIKEIARRFTRESLRISKLDGLTFHFKDWFLVVRPSNTEPLVRFFIGSKDEKVFRKTKLLVRLCYSAVRKARKQT